MSCLTAVSFTLSFWTSPRGCCWWSDHLGEGVGTFGLGCHQYADDDMWLYRAGSWDAKLVVENLEDVTGHTRAEKLNFNLKLKGSVYGTKFYSRKWYYTWAGQVFIPLLAHVQSVGVLVSYSLNKCKYSRGFFSEP